jgi:T5SS/PEP-CTERM-associated repeat protein
VIRRLLTTLLGGAVAAPFSLAYDFTWIGPSGDWTTPSNWSPPTSAPGGNLLLTQSPTNPNVIVNYVAPTTSIRVNLIDVSTTNGGSITFWQSDFMLALNTEHIGLAGGQGIVNQSGGSHTIGTLSIADTSPASSGTFALSGGVLRTFDERIGVTGSGVFIHIGGTHSIATQLIIGDQSTAQGLYQLASGGSSFPVLAADKDETIGNFAPGSGTSTGGTFLQSDGLHVVGNGSTGGSLYIGRQAGGTGSYQMDGGSLLVTQDAYVGYAGRGTFTQTGGASHVQGGQGVPSGLVFGFSNGARGDGLLLGGTLTVDFQEYVGFDGVGTFTQSGGSNSAAYIALGFDPTGNGTVTLSAGSLSVAAGTYVGYGGAGTFNQTGGDHSAPLFVMATTPGSSGVYNLSDGTLTIAAAAFIGNAGSGQFNQSGGAVAVPTLYLGYLPGASGKYTMTGGTLTVANATSNNGTVAISAGAASLADVAGSGSLTVGAANGAGAQVSVRTLAQSALTINHTGKLTIGDPNDPSAPRVTNTASTLSIAGDGLLDLTHHNLLTQTPGSTIRSYLRNAYHDGDWQGLGGITSSFALNDPITYTVGYANGDDPSSQDARPDVTAGSRLVVPTLSGDANLDGTVDFFDISQILGYKYNTGQQASYTDGDLNYDGVVDFFDITVVLSANYNSGVIFASPAAAVAAQATVPEPATAALALAGLAGMFFGRRFRAGLSPGRNRDRRSRQQETGLGTARL